MLFVGVDLVKIERWERILEKFPARAEKIFTPDEIAHCEKKGKKRAESYAAKRWESASSDRPGRMPMSHGPSGEHRSFI